MQWLLPLVTQADHQPVTVDTRFYWELSGSVSFVLGIHIRLKWKLLDSGQVCEDLVQLKTCPRIWVGANRILDTDSDKRRLTRAGT
jgi:hypothetical protein